MYYYSLNQYLHNNYGEKLYKLALDGGMTCPNRDGTVGTRGCIFCSNGGSGDFAEKYTGDINAQIENARSRISQKVSCSKYIAYFQSFSNTYAPVEKLECLFSSVIKRSDIGILSVATRPDCINEENAALLKSLNKIKPVWVELGLQTANEKAADYIRRGYDIATFENAMKLLSGLHIIVHVIIGLPGETREDMINTVRYISNTNAGGIKLQLLHVLKNTDLYEDYKAGKFKTLSKEEYLDIITELIEYLPPDMVIHRLTGDGAKKDLIAPTWSANKKDVLNSLNKLMLIKDTTQGKKYIPKKVDIYGK